MYLIYGLLYFWLGLQCTYAILDEDPNVAEDAKLNTYELINKYGYPAENYTVETEDGYILTMHRIANPGGTPVLLMHGLFDSSATWVLMGPEKSLGYLLHDQGYDVWMGNVRGNVYSRDHAPYVTDFWDFSFHEMGVYDLPAFIDFVLNETDSEKLHYIGHSQGTTSFWILGSEHPEYMEKIILMQALAPVAYLTHTKSVPFLIIADSYKLTGFFEDLVPNHEFLPSSRLVDRFAQVACNEARITSQFCTNMMFLFVGFNQEQLNETMLPVIVGHVPAGASNKQLLHFSQIRNSRNFQQYDYGFIQNLRKYKNRSPPRYRLDNVKAKVHLHYSKNDLLALPEDVENLAKQLPNSVAYRLFDFLNFNHVDLIWGIDAQEYLWDNMLAHMSEADVELEV